MARAFRTVGLAAGAVLLMTLTAFVSLTTVILASSLVARLLGW
ncbi:hypothetical protein [Enhydrobacter sp.]|nr:hypothetical protein [Enhydrobacter sp.]WIM09301.1 MAG: hypothetical protein OJF58_000252 [Enhydrobacter sp.]